MHRVQENAAISVLWKVICREGNFLCGLNYSIWLNWTF